jgi:hypothetical protein
MRTGSLLNANHPRTVSVDFGHGIAQRLFVQAFPECGQRAQHSDGEPGFERRYSPFNERDIGFDL